jgi:hypothetical protein
VTHLIEVGLQGLILRTLIREVLLGLGPPILDVGLARVLLPGES